MNERRDHHDYSMNLFWDPWDAVYKTADYATFEAAFAEIGNRAVFVSA